MVSFKQFQSKILLFGEYSIISNSQALAIPYPLFSGKLAIPSSDDERRHSSYSNQELQSFFCYLSQHCENTLRLNLLERDMEQGLYFDSNIPHGFGLGSSGALCAAIYSSYKKNGEVYGGPSVPQLKKIFSLMESHFHGHSSGMDPLISYLGCPLLSQSSEMISQIKVDFPNRGQAALFLINCRKARQTRPLIKFFLNKYKSAKFKTLFKSEINPLTNKCIDFFLQGDRKQLWSSFQQLSTYQLKHLEPMIPTFFHPLWEIGLKNKNFALKLCGAGGGGFFLGMANDFQGIREAFEKYDVQPILFF